MITWLQQYGFSHTQALVILALIVLQVTLMVAAAIALIRCKNPSPWGVSKPVWAVVIIFANLLGSILVLIAVAGSKQAAPPARERQHAARASDTIDTLYGGQRDE